MTAGVLYWRGHDLPGGGFIAGLVLSESPYGHQALSDVIPLRDLFGLIFFASVGMLFDPVFLVEHAGQVALLVVAVMLGKAPKDCNIITMHIGNGVSHTAIKNGVSVDTSMGLTPLEGAVMGTRCGDLDPAIPAFIMEKEGLSPKEIDSVLNKKAGILGITGQFTDRRDVIEGAEDGSCPRCQLALDVEAYRLKKYIGSYAAATGGIDAVVFTAGVGEMGWLIREKALEGLEFMGIILDREKNRNTMTRKEESVITTPDSPVKVFVIPTDEELVFTEDVVAILEGTYTDHMNFKYSFSSSDFQRK